MWEELVGVALRDDPSKMPTLGFAESLRRMSTASLTRIEESEELLAELDEQDQAGDREPSDEDGNDLEQQDVTLDSVAMDETNPIGGMLSQVDFSSQRPIQEEDDAGLDAASPANSTTSRRLSVRRFRPSLAPSELAMDVTTCIGGIMQSEDELDEEGAWRAG